MKIRDVDIVDAPTRGAAVVVDVLRAFTTAAWAFHLGAERLILVCGIDDATGAVSRVVRARPSERGGFRRRPGRE
jgi:phosphosulfolactate phosphohydrolase-like enzyme